MSEPLDVSVGSESALGGIPPIRVGTVAEVNGGQRLRWNGTKWEPYEERELTPFVTDRVGEWEVRNETPFRFALPIVNDEPRPGLYAGQRDIILAIRRPR